MTCHSIFISIHLRLNHLLDNLITRSTTLTTTILRGIPTSIIFTLWQSLYRWQRRLQTSQRSSFHYYLFPFPWENVCLHKFLNFNAQMQMGSYAWVLLTYWAICFKGKLMLHEIMETAFAPYCHVLFYQAQHDREPPFMGKQNILWMWNSMSKQWAAPGLGQLMPTNLGVIWHGFFRQIFYGKPALQ